MAYTIEFRPDEASVYLRHSGEVTLEDLEKSRSEIVPLIHRQDVRKLLVDVREGAFAMDLLEHFDFLTGLVRVFPPRLKVAVLLRPTFLEGTFIENVAVNRGIQLQVFADEPDALSWLGENGLPRPPGAAISRTA